ncbi:reverse transcriptase domain-containing protein [Tanacetum coccineum]
MKIPIVELKGYSASQIQNFALTNSFVKDDYQHFSPTIKGGFNLKAMDVIQDRRVEKLLETDWILSGSQMPMALVPVHCVPKKGGGSFKSKDHKVQEENFFQCPYGTFALTSYAISDHSSFENLFNKIRRKARMASKVLSSYRNLILKLSIPQVCRCKELSKCIEDLSPVDPVGPRGTLRLWISDLWGIDFMGPFPSYQSIKLRVSNIYSSAVDYLSTWVKRRSAPTHDARVVVKFLKSFSPDLDAPREQFISDLGPFL